MIIYGQEIGSFSYELFLAWCCALAPEIVKPQNNSRYDSQKKHIKKHIPSSNLEAHQYSSDPFAEPVRPYKPNIQPVVVARDLWHTIVGHLERSTECRQSKRYSWQVVPHVESCTTTPSVRFQPNARQQLESPRCARLPDSVQGWHTWCCCKLLLGPFVCHSPSAGLQQGLQLLQRLVNSHRNLHVAHSVKEE